MGCVWSLLFYLLEVSDSRIDFAKESNPSKPSGLLVTFAFGVTITGQFIMFQVGMVLIAFGAGEYPLAASSSAESSEVTDVMYRGRTVGLAFALQGWGNFVNTLMLLIMVYATSVGNCVPNYDNAIQNTSTCSDYNLSFSWRASYFVGMLFILGMLVFRFGYLHESEIWKERQDKMNHSDAKVREKETRSKQMRMLFCDPSYVFRLLGCSLSWAFVNVVFFGAMLFQSTLISVTIGKQPSLVQIYSRILINSAVSLVGYYVCAFTVDLEFFGRTRIQGFGFFVCTVLLLICGFQYDYLTQNVVVFEVLYYISSFFGQFGPNTTTFLLPTELFPTEVVSLANGIASASGKLELYLPRYCSHLETKVP